MEKRTFNIETRVDTNEEGRDIVVGHASVYDSKSNDLGGFYEYIERGAFTQEFEMPETSYGKDLAISMKRGDISQSSFAFTVAQDEWSTNDLGENIRTIKKIDMLYDTAIVTYPAYSQAESDLVVAQRGLKEYQESLVEETKEDIKEETENNLVVGSLTSLKIELIKRK